MYPTFKGNIFTKHCQEGKIKAKQKLRKTVIIITDIGTISTIDEPWLSV